MALRPRQPSVLVVSLPRSGSSWVGLMLGSADDALYLREPITQSDPAINRRVVFDPSAHPDLEPTFRRLADRAFLGWPDFEEKIVRMPEQWRLAGRRDRRVVIKEVNPLACRWFLERYRPRVVFLVRHPAAVAMSSRRMDWLGPTPEDWAIRGRDTGRLLREAREALSGYPGCITVFYEDLCTDPLENFRTLFDFAGLEWTKSVARRVRDYGRESPERIDAWRSEANPEAVAALRAGYEIADLPWYRDDEW